MEIHTIVLIIGLSLGMVGAVVLAFSLKPLNLVIANCIKFINLTVTALCNPTSPVPVFKGLDTQLDKGFLSAKRRNLFGVVMLGLSFLVQLIALFL